MHEFLVKSTKAKTLPSCRNESSAWFFLGDIQDMTCSASQGQQHIEGGNPPKRKQGMITTTQTTEDDHLRVGHPTLGQLISKPTAKVRDFLNDKAGCSPASCRVIWSWVLVSALGVQWVAWPPHAPIFFVVARIIHEQSRYINGWPRNSEQSSGKKWRLVGGIPTPLKNMSQLNWDDEISSLWKNKNVPNHHPVTISNNYRSTEQLDTWLFRSGQMIPLISCLIKQPSNARSDMAGFTH
jgi:hypothetical protein